MLTARYRQGELSYLLGDLPGARRALEAFTSAKVAHRGLEMAWTYLGDTCFGLQDFAPARIAYERSLSSYPSGRLAERAKYGLGRTLAELGEHERAISVLRELAAGGGPEWVERAWMQIGLIQKSAWQFAEAVDALVSLEKSAPSSALIPEARLHRAQALARLAKLARRKRFYEPCRRCAPEPTGTAGRARACHASSSSKTMPTLRLRH